MSHQKGGTAVLLLVASVSGNADAGGNELSEAAPPVSLLFPMMKTIATSKLLVSLPAFMTMS